MGEGVVVGLLYYEVYKSANVYIDIIELSGAISGFWKFLMRRPMIDETTFYQIN